jgi:hypothetical protein
MSTRSVKSVIHGASMNLGYKIAGISHLLQSYRSGGQRDREDEDMHGLGILMEDLSDQAMELSKLIERAEDVGFDTEVNAGQYERSEVITALTAVKQWIKQKREATNGAGR